MPNNADQDFDEVSNSEVTFTGADAFTAGGYIMLPKMIVHWRVLSHGAKLTYTLLLGYAYDKDRCFPGQSALADLLEVSTRMVRKYLDELKAAGLVSVIRRGLTKPNVYVLHARVSHTSLTGTEVPVKPGTEVPMNNNTRNKKPIYRTLPRRKGANADYHEPTESNPSYESRAQARETGDPGRQEELVAVASAQSAAAPTTDPAAICTGPNAINQPAATLTGGVVTESDPWADFINDLRAEGAEPYDPAKEARASASVTFGDRAGGGG